METPSKEQLMQANVDDILTAANGVNQIQKATARGMRETDEYPFFYVGGREVTKGDNDVLNNRKTDYNQSWSYRCQLYVEANTDNDREQNYEDYTKSETIVKDFLGNLLGDSEWELTGLDFYPANLAGIQIIVTDITLKKYHTNRY